jgi:hypothetical protein
VSSGPGGTDADRALSVQRSALHTTTRFQALGFGFAIGTTRPDLAAYLEHLLEPLSAPGEPEHLYAFVESQTGDRDRFDVYRDGELVSGGSHPSTALRSILWDVNHSMVETTTDLLLVHASATEDSGRAMIFPGAAGAGKTTLVAGLIRGGLRYLTDEAVAIEPDSGTVQPYPKPLAIDSGAWPILPGLRPVLDRGLPPLMEESWYVAPTAIRAGAVGGPSRPHFVIAPRYERDARTVLSEMRRSEALITLAEQSFNITRFGAARAMEMLADLVRGCRCFRLTMGDLDDACGLVLELLRGTPSDVARE